MEPEKTYNTFAEADAAADEEAKAASNAYNDYGFGAEDVTRKSAFKGST